MSNFNNARASAQDLDRDVDALLQDDDYSLIEGVNAGVQGLTILNTPSPSVAMSALSGTGSTAARSRVATPNLMVASSGGTQYSTTRGVSTPHTARALMRGSLGSTGGERWVYRCRVDRWVHKSMANIVRVTLVRMMGRKLGLLF